jgi:hypothetical protein
MGHEARLSTMCLSRLFRLQGANMRAMFAPLAVALLVACGTLPDRADPASDSPEARSAGGSPVKEAATYHEALTLWKNADDVNAWIDARFQYDMARAMQLSAAPTPSLPRRAASASTWPGSPSRRCARWTRRPDRCT